MARPRTRPTTLRPTDPISIKTQEILQHLSAAQGSAVDARVEVGRLLSELKAELGHGEWLFFVVDSFPFSTASAKRAIQLHVYSQGHPERYAKLRVLGLTKAYALMALPPQKLDAFLAQGTHEVRKGVVKTPLQMTFAEMMLVLHGEPEKEATPVRLAKAVRRFAKGLVVSVAALLDTPRFNLTDELEESLELISEESQRMLTLLPQALAAS